MKDYYSLLGIESKATKAEIKKNYRILANKYHPDKSDEPGTESKFIAITEAYDVLSNKNRRAQYDLYRWNELKQKQEQKRRAEESFTVVVPPYESTRSRRNKAQKKRSIAYHKSDAGSSKNLLMFSEYFYIIGRYVFHLLGITLLFAILISAFYQLPEAFEAGLLRGLIIALLAAAIIYGIFWITNNAIQELKKDIDAFSIFFKISKTTVKMRLILIFSFILLLYAIILKIYF